MEIMALYSEYPFAKRLSILIGADMAIALGDSFVPQNWSLVRDPIAIVQLAFMVLTMGITLRRVLEDY